MLFLLLVLLALLLLLSLGELLDGGLFQDVRVLGEDIGDAELAVGDGSQVGGCGLSSGLNHAVEGSVVVLQELLGGIELHNASGIKNDDTVAVNDGDESVSDGDNSTLKEVAADHALKHGIRLNVERRSSLVQKKDVRVEEQAAGHRDELALTYGEVSSVLFNVRFETTVESGDEILEGNHFQNMPDLIIVVLTEGVQVVADSSHEQLGHLRNDGQAAAEIIKTDGIDINVINEDTTSSRLGGTEEGSDEGGFSGSGTTDDTDLLARLDGGREAVKDRYSWFVCNGEVVELDLTLGRPLGGGLGFRDLVSLLLLDVVVLQDTLRSIHTGFELREEEGEGSKQGDNGDRVGASGNGQGNIVALRRVDAEQDEHQEDTSDDESNGGVGGQVEPLGQATKRQKVGRVVVDLVHDSDREVVLHAVSANSLKTIEGFSEVSEDGGAGDGFQTLELNRGTAVEHEENDVINQSEDHNDDGILGGDRQVDDDSEREETSVRGLLKLEGQHGINQAHILRETGQETTKRGLIVEGGGGVSDGVQEAAMNVTRRIDREAHHGEDEETNEDALSDHHSDVSSHVDTLAELARSLGVRPARKPDVFSDVEGSTEQVEDGDSDPETQASSQEVESVDSVGDGLALGRFGGNESAEGAVLVIALLDLFRGELLDLKVGILSKGILVLVGDLHRAAEGHGALHLSGARKSELLAHLVVLDETILDSQLVKGRLARDELTVGALLGDRASTEDDNVIGVRQELKLIGDEQDTAVHLTKGQTDVLEHVISDVGVDGREGVIEDEELAVAVHGTRNIHALALTSRQVGTLLSNLSQVSSREEREISDESAGVDDLLVPERFVRATESNVITDGSVDEEGLLRGKTDGRGHPDLTADGMELLEEGRGEGRLSGTDSSDDHNELSTGDFDVHVLQNDVGSVGTLGGVEFPGEGGIGDGHSSDIVGIGVHAVLGVDIRGSAESSDTSKGDDVLGSKGEGEGEEDEGEAEISEIRDGREDASEAQVVLDGVEEDGPTHSEGGQGNERGKEDGIDHGNFLQVRDLSFAGLVDLGQEGALPSVVLHDTDGADELSGELDAQIGSLLDAKTDQGEGLTESNNDGKGEEQDGERDEAEDADLTSKETDGDRNLDGRDNSHHEVGEGIQDDLRISRHEIDDGTTTSEGGRGDGEGLAVEKVDENRASSSTDSPAQVESNIEKNGSAESGCKDTSHVDVAPPGGKDCAVDEIFSEIWEDEGVGILQAGPDGEDEDELDDLGQEGPDESLDKGRVLLGELGFPKGLKSRPGVFRRLRLGQLERVLVSETSSVAHVHEATNWPEEDGRERIRRVTRALMVPDLTVQVL